MNTANKYGDTPVYIAARKGHLNAITALRNAGANMDMSNDEGETPVYIAAAKNLAESITALSNAEANVDKPHRKNGRTPLFIAAGLGYTAAVTALLNAGADSTVKTEGTTALENAKTSKRSNKDVINLLQDHDKKQTNIPKPPLLNQFPGKPEVKEQSLETVKPKVKKSGKH